MKKKVFAIVFTSIFSVCIGQKIVNICGEYEYHIPENITLEQAKVTAVNRAQTEALRKEFNQTIYQSNTTIINNKNGESSSTFYSLGGSEVKGEWIENTKEPEYEIMYEKNQLVIKVKVCGKAREIKSGGIDIISKVLRNGIEQKFESEYFTNGDDLYLYFSTPEDGYVCIYLFDKNTETCYCLLPYRNSEQGSVKVKHDTPYIFFYQDKKQSGWQHVDEYTLTCSKDVEYNDIYVIFSPNKFSKAGGNILDNNLMLGTLTWKDFQKWQTNCRIKDPQMQVKKHEIEIRRK